MLESAFRETPCGDGTMAWRVWGEGPPLIMLHGGAGSWRHWVLNIPTLAQHFTLYVADIPGLGDSANPPIPFDTSDFPRSVGHLADIICTGIDTLIGAETKFKILSFSFGSINSGYVAVRMGARIEHLVLVGAGALGQSWAGLPDEPKSLRAAKTDEERRAVHRHNLGILMIGDPDNIDDQAVYLQSENVARARLRSYRIAGTDTLGQALEQVSIPLSGIWGRGDIYAIPSLDQRMEFIQKVCPGADCRVIDEAGHWVMYEAPEAFNRIALEQLGVNTRETDAKVG